ncbi:type IV secretory system conjugative DNA transfer family protein (plasmid) [Pseudomonas amygdali pv. morsprunorum]
MTLEKQSPTTTTFEAIKSFSDDRVVSIEQTHELRYSDLRLSNSEFQGVTEALTKASRHKTSVRLAESAEEEKGDSFLRTAPPRSGKCVGVAIPNLLRYLDSVVVQDPIKDSKQRK